LYFKGKSRPAGNVSSLSYGTSHEGGTVRSGDYIFSMQRKRKSVGNMFLFVHHRIVSAAKSVDFVSDTMSYIVLRGCWCIIIVLNVPLPSEEKSDDSNDSFFDDLE
jgi:hypothetical protein